ncbi:MAG: hypothetical protein M1821_000809 [Bathelium mastoideum]|nr:MAG: hypothetical protein M1821_000809 [Bathelium mastoideum]
MPTDTSSSHKHIADFWVRLRSRKEGLTTEMLGAVVDNWHGMLENYVAESPWNALQLVASAARAVSAGTPLSDKDISTPSFVYSTSSLHLEIKKALPREGVEWLFMRAQVTEIKSGRLDATVYICNEKLELVALSHQVIFIFNRARTAGEEGQDSRKSKI